MKNYIILGAIIFIFVAMNLTLRPYLVDREAVNCVTTVLEGWKNNEIIPTYEYWENPNTSPPVSGLTGYTVLSHKQNKEIVDVFVRLDFAGGNVFPSGKQWDFVVEHTKFGWKIKDFLAVNN